MASALIVTLSEPLLETLLIVPPDPDSDNTLLVLFSTIGLELEKVPAPEKVKV